MICSARQISQATYERRQQITIFCHTTGGEFPVRIPSMKLEYESQHLPEENHPVLWVNIPSGHD